MTTESLKKKGGGKSVPRAHVRSTAEITMISTSETGTVYPSRAPRAQSDNLMLTTTCMCRPCIDTVPVILASWASTNYCQIACNTRTPGNVWTNF
jgi:hypothetical protein